ncbi:hypothetical protein PC39_15374 [Salinisphaera sp. PC39]|uniref:DUF4124 domain-containing protein n=1 Tax=Salinisphaera sp. PC39 TaxID=1304156 RepID=UPI00333F112B
MLLLLLVLMAAQAHAQDVYRWVDEDGVVHYSDRSRGEAERVRLPELQRMDSIRGTAGNEGESSSGAAAVGVRIERPRADETFRDPRGLVPVSVGLSGELASGRVLIYYLDGRPALDPTRRPSVQLQGVPRGEHRVSVAIREGGEEIARSEAVTFYMRPPSSLSPTSESDSGAPTAPGSGGVQGAPAAPRPGAGGNP